MAFDDETAEPLEVIDLGPAEEEHAPRPVRRRPTSRAIGSLVAAAVLGIAALVTVGTLNRDETRAARPRMPPAPAQPIEELPGVTVDGRNRGVR